MSVAAVSTNLYFDALLAANAGSLWVVDQGVDIAIYCRRFLPLAVPTCSMCIVVVSLYVWDLFKGLRPTASQGPTYTVLGERVSGRAEARMEGKPALCGRQPVSRVVKVSVEMKGH